MCISLQHIELRKYFKQLCDKYGILYTMSDIIKGGREYIKKKQMVLF